MEMEKFTFRLRQSPRDGSLLALLVAPQTLRLIRGQDKISDIVWQEAAKAVLNQGLQKAIICVNRTNTDSSGIGALIALTTHLMEQGIRVAVVYDPKSFLGRTLQISKLCECFPCFPDLSEALDKL